MIKPDTIKNVQITLYHSNTKECGNCKNITSNGDSGKMGTCASTSFMFDYHLNYGDTVRVLDGEAKGKYVVNDKAKGNTKLIDIWKPLQDKSHFSYMSRIIIMKGKV
jgi:hypothetical protein